MEWLDATSKYAAAFVAVALPAGAGAFFGSYLKKKGENVATHEDIAKLVRQVEAVTTATKQIEETINRASRVYERQLDILQKLYRCLYDVHHLFRRMTATGRLEGEATPEQYATLLDKAIVTAHEEFLNGRLFVPPLLVSQCDEFFDAVSDGKLVADLARDRAIQPLQRAHFNSSAAEVAHQKVPKMLHDIYDSARSVIHGEET